MVVDLDFIQNEYPLHWLVWHDMYQKLDEELASNQWDKEKVDCRGRTPLMLAVTLGHLESIRVLLNRDANVNCENRQGWTVVQEAVATGDPELLHLILERRDFQQYASRIAGIPGLLQKLNDAPDFYVEMKWEFTSWVPLVSRMCPSDTYKVYKQGSSVRVDTTLLGFEQNSWQRGNRTYIFQGHNDGATMMEIDHDQRQVYTEEMRATPDEAVGLLMTTEESVIHRLTHPIVTTFVDTEKISFERNKSGMWGWRSDKMETVNGHDCKVFGASNVELVTRSRTEHLTESDKLRCSKAVRSPLQSIFGMNEVEPPPLPLPASGNAANTPLPPNTTNNPQNIRVEEYFDDGYDLAGRDIGRPREINVKIQKFRANLWLSEQYPLSLPEQILPIVDLMAISSSHFAKLKDFIQLQLPSGFPVKIEIPLFHVLNARITFGNIFGMDAPVDSVQIVRENDRISCVLDEAIFQCPSGYTNIGDIEGARRQYGTEEEDELLQFAIQQSLLDVGTEKEEVDIWEALKSQKPSRAPSPAHLLTEEERQLQRAIQASLELCPDAVNCPQNNGRTYENDPDPDLHMALLLSEEDQKKRQEQQEQEEKLLQDALQLSLQEQ